MLANRTFRFGARSPFSKRHACRVIADFEDMMNSILKKKLPQVPWLRLAAGSVLAAWIATTDGAGAASYGDITFFVGSDSHYGGRSATQVCAQVSQATLSRMNALPGQEYPATVGGGIVAAPRGVLLLGDLTEESPHSWQAFTNDWGLTGERLLKFPVYEGYGNHDCLDPTVPEGIKARNRIRPGLSNISSNGYHYSWDWDFLHLVCLNLFPANEVDNQKPPHDPRHSLDFLVDDLARNVGRSGRPVIVCHHYGVDGNSNLWWSDQQRTNFFEALKNYNVVEILSGHTHNVLFTTWCGLDTCNDGTVGKFAGTFLVAHVTATNLTLVTRLADNNWGPTFTKAITNGVVSAP